MTVSLRAVRAGVVTVSVTGAAIGESEVALLAEASGYTAARATLAVEVTGTPGSIRHVRQGDPGIGLSIEYDGTVHVFGCREFSDYEALVSALQNLGSVVGQTRAVAKLEDRGCGLFTGGDPIQWSERPDTTRTLFVSGGGDP